MKNHRDYDNIADWSVPEIPDLLQQQMIIIRLGMIMPGRTKSTEDYRFGFNGKENLNEVKGVGNLQDFGARIYDCRLSKWLSIDPSAEKYPGMSPYIAFANSPIQLRDPDGKDIVYSCTTNKDGNKTLIVTVNAKMINLSSQMNNPGYMEAIKSLATTEAGKILSGEFKDPSGATVNVQFKLNITIVNDINKIGKNDHVIGIVDDAIRTSDDEIDPGGKAERNLNTQIVETKNSSFDYMVHTIVHELGHNIGLPDEYTAKDGKVVKSNSANLMGAGEGTDLENWQRSAMFYRFTVGKSGQNNYRNSVQKSGDSKEDFKKFIEKNAKVSK